MTRIYYILLAGLLIGCGSDSQKSTEPSNDEIRKEVMDIHDEAMPRMSELRKIEKQLRERAENLAATDSVLALRHAAAADAIEKANDEMMQWMRDYESDFEGSNEEIKSYLKKQKDAIIKVRENMNKSLEEGEKLISE